VEIADILSHNFSQKFRESNGLTEKITKYLLGLTKFFVDEREFLIFSTLCFFLTISNLLFKTESGIFDENLYTFIIRQQMWVKQLLHFKNSPLASIMTIN